jgi:cobalt/nickel transport system permease protein
VAGLIPARRGAAVLPREDPRAPGWTRLAPQAKLAALVLTAAAVVAVPSGATWPLVAVAALVLAALSASHVPVRWLLGRLWIGLPFVGYAALLPLVTPGPGPRALGLTWSAAGCAAGATLVVKATLSLLAATWVAATTPTPQLLRGAERLGAPALLTAVAGFMLRYVELVVDDLRRTRIAMAARGFGGRGVAGWRILAAALGHLFVRTFERGERVHYAMLARGYNGRLPPTGGERASARTWVLALTPPLLVWAGVLVAHLAA